MEAIRLANSLDFGQLKYVVSKLDEECLGDLFGLEAAVKKYLTVGCSEVEDLIESADKKEVKEYLSFV